MKCSERRCTGPCKRTLPLTGFHPDKCAPSGYRSRCRDCQNAYQRQRRLRLGRTATRNGRARTHGARNCVRILGVLIEGTSPHHGVNRRARMLDVPTHPFRRSDVLARHPRSCCAYCGTRLTADSFQADHVVPLLPRDGERQGCHCLANLAPACPTCNVRKSNRQPSLDLFLELWDRVRNPHDASPEITLRGPN